VACHTDKLDLIVIAMGITNWLSKPREPINKNLTGCLQRYVILRYERMRKYLIFNTNNIAFQILPREHHFDFHRRPGKICGTSSRCLNPWSPVSADEKPQEVRISHSLFCAQLR
jgi:hypothetical protein